MPVWSLTMVATKVTSRLLPGRTKASTECWGSEFLLKNIRQFQLWFPFHKETYFWFWILLLPVLHKSVSLQHWQHQTSLNSCPLVPRCPKFSCGGLSSCLLSFLSPPLFNSFETGFLTEPGSRPVAWKPLKFSCSHPAHSTGATGLVATSRWFLFLLLVCSESELPCEVQAGCIKGGSHHSQPWFLF